MLHRLLKNGVPGSEYILLTEPAFRFLQSRNGFFAESFGRKAMDRRKKAYRAELYPKVLIRPICRGCGNPMILGRSVGTYQGFFCFNASSGIKGCTNRGYKSARVIDEAILGKVMATLFTDGFISDLTADVNASLAELARRPKVKSVQEQDVVAALGKLRDLLQGDVGVAAQVLKALVGDVVIETRQVEGQQKPQMVTRLSINAVPALAVLERGMATAAGPTEAIVPLTYNRRAAVGKAGRNRDGAT